MHSIRVNDFADWRRIARELIAKDCCPGDVHFLENDGQASLFGEDPSAEFEEAVNVASHHAVSVPRGFLSFAQTVGYHRDPSRWSLLYRLLWRLTHGEPALLQVVTDDDIRLATQFEKQVRRDSHKMKAFVRFRKVVRQEVEYFIAWHRPDHRIVQRVAPFFSRRFKSMNWTIMTPDETAVWDQKTLTYSKGVPRSAAPRSDELEELWKTYYANIFNPARVKIKMMKSEMPVRHWQTLPEAELIADLIADAPKRVEEMIEKHEGFATTAAELIASSDETPRTLEALTELASTCTACDLHHQATQTVFGVGPSEATIAIVGEQPGDQEDQVGQPFVGPAGKVLDDAMQLAGIERDSVYLTNVVKHFKHTMTSTPKGKKRLHQKPAARELRCCKPWLEAELAIIKPKAILCLGATAAKALISPGFKITQQRGECFSTDWSPRTLATFHPSAILRMTDQERSKQQFDYLVADLKLVAEIALRLDKS